MVAAKFKEQGGQHRGAGEASRTKGVGRRLVSSKDSQLPATEAWPHWPELRDGWAWEMVQPQGAGVPLGLAEPAVSWGQASRTPWGRGKESGSP